MSDEERLQAITEQLIIVRDNLFRGMSKSIQKLQARAINEVLELPNFTESPKRTWVGLTDVEWMNIVNKDQAWFGQRPDEVAHEVAKLVEAKLKEKNT